MNLDSHLYGWEFKNIDVSQIGFLSVLDLLYILVGVKMFGTVGTVKYGWLFEEIVRWEIWGFI